MKNATYTPDAETRRVFINLKDVVFIKGYRHHDCHTVDLADVFILRKC